MATKRKARRDGIDNCALILRAANRNWSARRIATRYGLHVRTVRRHLRANGIGAVKSPLHHEPKVMAMVKQHGVAMAAQLLGVSRQAIYLRLAEWDLA